MGNFIHIVCTPEDGRIRIPEPGSSPLFPRRPNNRDREVSARPIRDPTVTAFSGMVTVTSFIVPRPIPCRATLLLPGQRSAGRQRVPAALIVMQPGLPRIRSMRDPFIPAILSGNVRLGSLFSAENNHSEDDHGQDTRDNANHHGGFLLSGAPSRTYSYNPSCLPATCFRTESKD